MTWDMATVTPTFLSLGPGSHHPRRVCGGTVGLEFGFSFVLFFPLDSCFFFKDGKLTRIALYTLGTGWKDFGIAVGAGDTNQTDALFPVLFLFSKTDKCDSGACPLPGGVTHGLPHLTAPIENLPCLALKTPEFFVHLQPLLPTPL